MSRVTESKAKKYLIDDFKSSSYRFYDKKPNDKGFDLWMENTKTGEKIKIELKASESEYTTPSNIFQKLYFSAENEVENFRKGETKIVRIFMGNTPPKVFIFDKEILSSGAKFEDEYRAKIVGKKTMLLFKKFSNSKTSQTEFINIGTFIFSDSLF